MSSFIGTFYIPTLSEQEQIARTYVGYGDPNLKDASFFQPAPHVGDRYLQLDTDPIVEWVFTKYSFWVEVSLRFDSIPPDFTKVMDMI